MELDDDQNSSSKRPRTSPFIKLGSVVLSECPYHKQATPQNARKLYIRTLKKAESSVFITNTRLINHSFKDDYAAISPDYVTEMRVE